MILFCPFFAVTVCFVYDVQTVNDYVNVVAFNSAASVPRCARDGLLQATPENIAYLQDFVQKLSGNGQTDMYRAFDAAFDLFETTGERTADCQRALLFLTDGQPTNVEDHEELIRTRNANLNAHIFTYALGSGAIEQKSIACDNEGVYTSIEDGGNLRGKMSSYYQLFALSAPDSIFWTRTIS